MTEEGTERNSTSQKREIIMHFTNHPVLIVSFAVQSEKQQDLIQAVEPLSLTGRREFEINELKPGHYVVTSVTKWEDRSGVDLKIYFATGDEVFHDLRKIFMFEREVAVQTPEKAFLETDNRKEFRTNIFTVEGKRLFISKNTADQFSICDEDKWIDSVESTLANEGVGIPYDSLKPNDAEWTGPRSWMKLF